MNVPGKRTTRQRTAIVDALGEMTAFLSAQQIHEALNDRGARVGLATVYRTLQAMAVEGMLDVLHSGDGETLYRRCASGAHHHHIVCRSCRTTVEVASDEVERWANAQARKHGFVDATHTIEVYGICADCA